MPKVRLNLDLPPSAKERLENLRDLSEADSFSQVVGRSLAVYEMFLFLTRNGDRIYAVGNDGEKREILLVP